MPFLTPNLGALKEKLQVNFTFYRSTAWGTGAGVPKKRKRRRLHL